MEIVYVDGQVFESRKQSFIAVASKEGKIIYFNQIDYAPIQGTEGHAILKALEHFKKNNITDAKIYTDSQEWSHLTNKRHRVNKQKAPEIYALFRSIMDLKTELNITVEWQTRETNKAGKFLSEVWRMKKEKRNSYFTP